ncbi:MAG TPA: sulfocyanin-like copper-binding protein, partial [Gaiellaceae bacterium]|nr:sulfocyanin-like copper-binding protein [Gaiellaceae bacterium]
LSAALALPLLAGCSSHSTAVPATTAAVPQTSTAPLPGRPDPHRFLASDPATKRVRLTMIAGLGSSNNGYNFDDYGRGELLVSVPRGWRVTVDCRNHASRRASCAVVTGARSATIPFPGAAIAQPLQGLPSGGEERFSFTPSRTGVYRITSLVPGQAEARMYAVLVVTSGGRPSISARPGP